MAAPDIPPGFDFTDPEIYTTRVPAEELAELRRAAPVWWVTQRRGSAGFDDEGYWAVTRHADVMAVSKAPEVYSSEENTALIRFKEGIPRESIEMQRIILLNMDPPQHTKLRGIVSRGFTPRAIGNLRDTLAERARRIVATALESGTGDFVQDVACELPLQAISELIGVPQYGRGLQALGLNPGETVAGMLPNSTDALALFFAALQTGLYVIPVNWHLTAAEVAYILTDSGARAFVAHERFAAIAADAAGQTGIDPEARFAAGQIPGFTPLTALGADTAGRPDPRTTGAPMVYTSGTSGRPKGVRRPLTGEDPDRPPWPSTWFFGIFSLAPFDGNVHLCCSPLYHTAVLNFATISVQLGHPVVFMDRFDAGELLALIEQHRVTHTHMVPTQFRRLLALPRQTRENYDTSSLRAAIHSAAPCPREVKQAMLDWWGPVVTEYYAASEGGGTVITGPQWLARPGSVGLPWPGCEVHVLDADGNDAPAGQPGLVYMRMGTATFDYHKDEEKTRASRARGMFTVGDIGYLDADGYLFLCDRKSDMIISGGVNIYPAEIEAALSGHPAVDDVAVFGIPHDEWGEEIKAVVQPAPDVEPGPALTAGLLAFLGGRVAKFKLPRSIDYVSELPRDPNGKLYKRRLRDPYWAGRDRAI